MSTRTIAPSSPLAAARRVMTFVCVCLLASTAKPSSSCPTHSGFRVHSHRHHLKRSSNSSSGLRRRRGTRPSCGGGRCYGHAVACWATPSGGRIGWLPRMRTDKDCACSLTIGGMPAAERASSRAAPVRSLLTMKARGKRGRAGGGRPGGKGGATATAAGRGSTKQKKAALYIQIEDLERDSWRYAYKHTRNQARPVWAMARISTYQPGVSCFHLDVCMCDVFSCCWASRQRCIQETSTLFFGSPHSSRLLLVVDACLSKGAALAACTKIALGSWQLSTGHC